MNGHQISGSDQLDLLLETANQQFAQAQLNAAFASYSEILVLTSNKYIKQNRIRALAHIGRGHIQMQSERQGSIDEALRSYQQALIIDPNIHQGMLCLSEAYLGCAHVYLALKDDANAFQCAVDAVVFDPTSIHARKLLDQYTVHSHPLFAHAKVLMIDSNLIESNLACAQFYLQNNKLEHAIYFTKKVLEVDPKSNDAYINLIRIYFMQQKFNEAILVCNKALEFSPKNVFAYYTRGISYHKLNKFDEAIADYQLALKLHPEEAKIQIYCIFAYLDKHEYTTAIENISKMKKYKSLGIGVQTDFKDCYLDTFSRLGDAYLKEKSFDVATLIFQFILKFDSKCEEAKKALKEIVEKCVIEGRSELSNHHLSKALFYLNIALQIHPKSETACRYRGIAHFRVNNFSAAISDLKRALNMNSKITNSHYYIGRAFYAVGDFQQAIFHLEKAVSMNKRFTKAQLALNNARGMKLMQNDKVNTAREFFLMTLSQNPRDTNAKLGMAKVQHAYLDAADYYYKLNDFDMAKDIYNKVLLMNSDCREASAGLRNISHARNNLDMAQTCHIKVNNSLPSNLRANSIFPIPHVIVPTVENKTTAKPNHKKLF